MAEATRNVVCTIMGDRQLGSTWDHMILNSLSPMDREGSLYSWLRTVSTAALVILTNSGTLVIPTATIRFSVL